MSKATVPVVWKLNTPTGSDRAETHVIMQVFTREHILRHGRLQTWLLQLPELLQALPHDAQSWLIH